jgi:hypothetical protein
MQGRRHYDDEQQADSEQCDESIQYISHQAVASPGAAANSWWAVQVSNLRPSACKADALPLS